MHPACGVEISHSGGAKTESDGIVKRKPAQAVSYHSRAGTTRIRGRTHHPFSEQLTTYRRMSGRLIPSRSRPIGPASAASAATAGAPAACNRVTARSFVISFILLCGPPRCWNRAASTTRSRRVYAARIVSRCSGEPATRWRWRLRPDSISQPPCGTADHDEGIVALFQDHDGPGAAHLGGASEPFLLLPPRGPYTSVRPDRNAIRDPCGG